MRQTINYEPIASGIPPSSLPESVRINSTHVRSFQLVVLILFSVCLFHQRSYSQISPPGLSNTKLAVWAAAGFSQHVGKQWNATTYLGISRESDPDSWSLLRKQAISVFNQEFVYQFNNHWQLSIAGSFRRQEEYQAEPPYQVEAPSFRYEIRYYSRLYYRHQVGKVSFTYTFRPELRTFYQPDWQSWSTPLELRFRFKAQVSVPLNANKTNLFISGNEFLTALDEYKSSDSNTSAYWSSFRFTEDRFTVYFRHVFKKPSLALDIGLMEQSRKVSNDPKLHEATYLAVDLLFQDPFGRH